MCVTVAVSIEQLVTCRSRSNSGYLARGRCPATMVGAGRRRRMIGVDLPARRPGVPLAGAAEAGDRAGAGRARTQVLVAGNWKRPRWRCSLTTLMVANRPRCRGGRKRAHRS